MVFVYKIICIYNWFIVFLQGGVLDKTLYRISCGIICVTTCTPNETPPQTCTRLSFAVTWSSKHCAHFLCACGRGQSVRNLNVFQFLSMLSTVQSRARTSHKISLNVALTKSIKSHGKSKANKSSDYGHPELIMDIHTPIMESLLELWISIIALWGL